MEFKDIPEEAQLAALTTLQALLSTGNSLGAEPAKQLAQIIRDAFIQFYLKTVP